MTQNKERTLKNKERTLRGLWALYSMYFMHRLCISDLHADHSPLANQ